MGNYISVIYINNYKNKKEKIKVFYDHQLTCLELTRKILEKINITNYYKLNIEDLDILVKANNNDYYQIIEKKYRSEVLMKWKYLRFYHKGIIYDFIIKYPVNYF